MIYTANPPFDIKQVIENEKTDETGTTITIKKLKPLHLKSDNIRQQVGMRFLANPGFTLEVNGEVVKFDDISDLNKEIIDLKIDEKKHSSVSFY